MELRGTACLVDEDLPVPKKGIVASRSFASGVSEKDVLMEAVMNFVARAARKLRKDGSRAGHLSVYIATSRFTDGYYCNSAHASLPLASDFNPTLMAHARLLLGQVYKSGLVYKKAGVMLSDITSDDQLDLLETRRENPDLMKLIDHTNRRYGKEMLQFACQGTKKAWRKVPERRSPRYTSCWDEILRVRK